MKRWYTILLLALGTAAMAQDPEFSQYYSAPLNLNPAFAGTATDHRLIANYRNQWPSVANGFVTYALSYDYNLSHLNSGLGFMILTDRAGSANLRSTIVNFQYSYKVNFNRKVMLSTGLNFGIGFRGIDYNKLVFGDQLSFDSDGNVPTIDPIAGSIESSNYFDFGAGVLLYSRTFWMGFAGQHLNRPNRSLLEDQEAEIPMKFTVHGGVRIPLYNGPFKKERVAAVAPSFIYKQQGNFDQLDLGAYFLYEPVVVGLWYRGIPIKQNVRDNISQDAVVIVIGFQMKKVELSYSYDLTVSDLGPVAGGAHEVALKYKLNVVESQKTKKKEKFIPCPTFIKVD
jgi:type IX secretion system PorP/SprF family membrane protein